MFSLSSKPIALAVLLGSLLPAWAGPVSPAPRVRALGRRQSSLSPAQLIQAQINAAEAGQSNIDWEGDLNTILTPFQIMVENSGQLNENLPFVPATPGGVEAAWNTVQLDEGNPIIATALDAETVGAICNTFTTQVIPLIANATQQSNWGAADSINVTGTQLNGPSAFQSFLSELSNVIQIYDSYFDSVGTLLNGETQKILDNINRDQSSISTIGTNIKLLAVELGLFLFDAAASAVVLEGSEPELLEKAAEVSQHILGQLQEQFKELANVTADLNTWQQAQQALGDGVGSEMTNRALVDGFPSYVQAGANAASMLQAFLDGMNTEAENIKNWVDAPSVDPTAAPPIIQAYISTGTTVYTSACPVFSSWGLSTWTWIEEQI